LKKIISKEKLAEEEKNSYIKSVATKKKINNNSYSMAIKRINKRIDNVIKKCSSNRKMSILGLVKSLFELNIIN